MYGATLLLNQGGVTRMINALIQVRELTDNLAKSKQACILGSKDKVLKNIAQIMEIANGK